MRVPGWIAIRRTAFVLLGFVSILALAQSELEAGQFQPALRNLDIQISTLVLLLFFPTLAIRLRHAGTSAGLSMEDRAFASSIEAALYGLMLIQPIAAWLVAALDQQTITVLGVSLPRLASGDRVLAGAINAFREVSAGLVLLLLALHVRNRGMAMLAATERSLARAQKHPRTRGLDRPEYTTPHRPDPHRKAD